MFFYQLFLRFYYQAIHNASLPMLSVKPMTMFLMMQFFRTDTIFPLQLNLMSIPVNFLLQKKTFFPQMVKTLLINSYESRFSACESS